MGEILEKLAQIKKQGALEEFLNRLTPEEKQRLNQKIDEELAQESKQKEAQNEEQQNAHPIINKAKELGSSLYTGTLEGAVDFNKLLAGLIPFQKPKDWFLQTFVNPYEKQIQQERQAHPGMLNELARGIGSMGVTTPLDIMTGGATREGLLAREFAPKFAQVLSKSPKFALGMGVRKGIEGYQQAQPGVTSKVGGALTGAAQGLGEGLAYHRAGELPLKFRLPAMGAMGAGFGAMGGMEQGRVPNLETAKRGAIQGIAQEAILSLLGGIGGRVRNKADRNAHIRVEKIVKEYIENPEKAMPKLQKTLKAIESSKSISEDYKTAIKQSNLPAILTGKYPVKFDTPKVIEIKTFKEEGVIPGAEGKIEVEGKPEAKQVEGKPETSAIIDETVNKKALLPAAIPLQGKVEATTKPIPIQEGKIETTTKPIPLSGEIKNTEHIYGKEREVVRMPDGSFALANDEDVKELGYNGFLKRKDWNKLEKYKGKIDKAYNHLIKKLDVKPPKYLEEEVKKMAISHSLSNNSKFKGKPLQALKFAFDREYKNFLEGKAKRVKQLEKFAKIKILEKQLKNKLQKGEKVNPEDLRKFPSLADKYNYDYKTGLPKISERINEINEKIRKKYKIPELTLIGDYKNINREEFEKLRQKAKELERKYAKEFINKARKYIKENTLSFKNKPIRGVQYNPNPNPDVVPEWAEEYPFNYIQKVNSPATRFYLNDKDREILNKFYDEYEEKISHIDDNLLLSEEDLKETGFYDEYPHLETKQPYKEKKEFKPKEVWEMTPEEFFKFKHPKENKRLEKLYNKLNNVKKELEQIKKTTLPTDTERKKVLNKIHRIEKQIEKIEKVKDNALKEHEEVVRNAMIEKKEIPTNVLKEYGKEEYQKIRNYRKKVVDDIKEVINKKGYIEINDNDFKDLVKKYNFESVMKGINELKKSEGLKTAEDKYTGTEIHYNPNKINAKQFIEERHQKAISKFKTSSEVNKNKLQKIFDKKVWEMSKEQFAQNSPKGYKYYDKLPHEAMVDVDGDIVLGDKFFDLSKAERKSVIAHEIAHLSGIEEKALKDPEFWRMVQKEKMYGELDKDTGEIKRGINGHYLPNENLVESYKLLFEDPDWLKKNYPKAYEYVIKLAKKENLPLPENIEIPKQSKEEDIIKTFGFYKSKNKNEWIYVRGKKGDEYKVTFVDINVKPSGKVDYSEDYDTISKKELEDLIKDKKTYVAYKNKKRNIFYAIWDGANKKSFKYIIPKHIVEDLGLKKYNFPEQYYKEQQEFKPKEVWEMTKEEFLEDTPKGYRYNSKMPHEAMVNEKGQIVLSKKFFQLSKEERKSIIAREMAHKSDIEKKASKTPEFVLKKKEGNVSFYHQEKPKKEEKESEWKWEKVKIINDFWKDLDNKKIKFNRHTIDKEETGEKINGLKKGQWFIYKVKHHHPADYRIIHLSSKKALVDKPTLAEAKRIIKLVDMLGLGDKEKLNSGDIELLKDIIEISKPERIATDDNLKILDTFKKIKELLNKKEYHQKTKKEEELKPTRDLKDILEDKLKKGEDVPKELLENYSDLIKKYNVKIEKDTEDKNFESFNEWAKRKGVEVPKIDSNWEFYFANPEKIPPEKMKDYEEYKKKVEKKRELIRQYYKERKEKSEFYDGQPIASDKHGTFVIKKKNGKLSIYYQMKSQDIPDSLAVGFHEDIKDALRRLKKILPNVFKGDEYSYVNPKIKKALKEVEAEEKAEEEKKKQKEKIEKEKEEILRKKINNVRNFWQDLDKVKLKFKKHTVKLDSGVKVDGYKRGQWFIYKIKSGGNNEYSILHLPSMKALPEQPTFADAKRVVKLIEMVGFDKKKTFNNLDLEILKDINRISKLNEKSIDSFEAIKDLLLKKDKMRQTLNYFLDSHIPTFKKKTFISKDGEKRSGLVYKDWAIEKAQLKDGTVFYRIFHLPSGFMIESSDSLKEAKRTIAVYDLMGLDRFKFKDKKDVTKEITDMYRDAGRLAALSEKADIRGELEEFDKKYHILEKMGVTTKLYAGIPIHEVFKAFKDLKREASEKYHEMTGIDKVIDKDLKLWEKVFKTPQWLAKKYKSIKKILDLEDLKTYTKITKYSNYLRRLENGDELLLSKMNKKEKQAFSDILIALDKYNNSIIKTEREHGIYEYGKISPFAKEIIDSILDQHNLSKKERDRVWRLYQNWFDIAHEIRHELIETLKQTKDKDLIDKYMKDVGYVKYYFPRLRESGNTAIRVYDKNGNLVHLEFTDTLLKGKSPKAHLKAIREIRKLYPKEEGYRIRITKNVKGEELDHFNEFLNVAMVKDILESITDKDNDELKKIYAQKLANLFKSRGFLSHAIKRREDYITGFEDERVADVIKKFLAGYSGFVGKKKFVEKLIEEKPKIDRANINERKAVNQMIKHLLRNENAADRISARIKTLLFMKYIAGKVSTPVLNLTQTAITTAPTLAKEIGNLPKAYKIVAKNTSKALRLTIDILKNKPHIFFTGEKKPSYLTQEEWNLVREAYNHGDFNSKLAQDFRGKIEGAFRGKLADILIDKPAMLMDATETYNRVLALLSGYEGLKDVNKARELMRKTQFDYSKANVPIAFMGEGNTGAALRSFYTFRRYGHNLLQLWGELAKEDKRAFLASLSTVASIGGVTALPLVDWLFNELAKKTGKDYKREIEEYLNEAIGSKLTDIFMRGLPTLIGIDMSGQVGIDIPFFSPYNNSKNLLTYLFKEFSGAAGQTALDAQKTVNYIMKGQYKKALELSSPAYVSYPLKVQRMASEGVTKADNSPILIREGKTIKPLKLTKKEAIMKAVGFQSLRLNKIYETRRSIKNIEEYFKNKKQNIYNKLRAYAYLKKGDRKEIMRQIVNYNKELYKKSPDLYRSMRITRRSIRQAIRLNLRPEDKILITKGVK